MVFHSVKTVVLSIPGRLLFWQSGHLMRGIRETFMTTLNLGNLATFRLVVQRGSFSAAADALGISQPAVSLQVRQLEQFLQTRLLERTGRGIKATAAGMALLAHSEQIDRAVNSAVQSVSAFSQEVNGSLTLGTGATACIHLLPPLLQHLPQPPPPPARGGGG
ncbi:transcriptional regulator, LysR family, partial [Klebsiella sp. MS 92-3]